MVAYNTYMNNSRRSSAWEDFFRKLKSGRNGSSTSSTATDLETLRADQAARQQAGAARTSALTGGRWYEVPDLTISNGRYEVPQYYLAQSWDDPNINAMLAGGNEATIPDWAATSFTDPLEFYDWYQDASQSDDFAGIVANLSSAATAASTEEAARQAAIDRLSGTRTTIEQEMTGLSSDPTRQAILAEFQRRASPEYSVITPLQQTAYENQLARDLARTTAATLSSAAGRGTTGSGTTLNQLAGQRVAANLGGLQLRSGIDTANEQARAEALNSILSMSDTDRAVEQSYLNALATLDAQIAAYEAGVEVEPTDFLAFNELQFGREQYQDALDLANKELEAYEESERWGNSLDDWIQLALAIPGQGLFS